ncbi:hypothetical protein Emed_003171 [Eimeria media]
MNAQTEQGGPPLPCSAKVEQEESSATSPQAKRIAGTSRVLPGASPGAWGQQPKSSRGEGQGDVKEVPLQSGCQHAPRKEYLTTRVDPQPSALVHHPHRARWLAAKGLTPESLALTYIVGKDYFREADAKQMKAAAQVYDNQALAILRMEDPFDSELIQKLARATPACLGTYLEKLGFVEKELVTALRRGSNLHREALQRILETTGDIAKYLLADDSDGDDKAKSSPSEEAEEMDFHQRLTTVLKEFCSGRLEEQPQSNPRGSCSDAAMLLLQRHVKCVWVLKLFHQLKPKHLWTHTAIMSFVRKLWRRPAEHMAARFAHYVPLYDLALVVARLPPDNSTEFVTSVPQDVRTLVHLFRRCASQNE